MLLVVFRSSPESAAFPLTNPECLSSFGVQSSCSNVLRRRLRILAPGRPRCRLAGTDSHRTHLHAHSTLVGSRSARPNPKPGPVPSSLNLFTVSCEWPRPTFRAVSTIFLFDRIYLLGSLRYSRSLDVDRVRLARHLSLTSTIVYT